MREAWGPLCVAAVACDPLPIQHMRVPLLRDVEINTLTWPACNLPYSIFWLPTTTLAQAGVPSPCESQSHSPRIAAHRPEAEGGEECRVGSQTEVAEGGAAEGDATPILVRHTRSPLPDCL